MIVKFFHQHGRGKADSAARYLLSVSKPAIGYLTGSRTAKGTKRRVPPVVVRGDADLTRRLINQVKGKKWRYTSGVLSFREIISPENEQRIIDSFEKRMFAGLRPGQYDCVWIRHVDHARSELHFLTPRVEMTSGKALNIRPPGKQADELSDAWRTLINHDFELRDPDPKFKSLTPADIEGLREKLERLSGARAKYNRERFPLPEVDQIKSNYIEHHDRTRSSDGCVNASGSGLPSPRVRDYGTFEPLSRAGRAIGQASHSLKLSGECLGRATLYFPKRLTEIAARHRRKMDSRTLFGRYGIPETNSSTVQDREIEGDDLDLSDSL